MGVARTAPLPPELGVRYWERKLREESVPEDPINSLRGVHSTEKRVTVTNEIFIDLQGGFGDTERYHRMVLQKRLSGPMIEGSLANPVGQEEDLRQKIFDIYATDIFHAVSIQEYGIEAKTKDYWQIFEEINPLEAVYQQEYDGKYMREALLERYSQNLTAAPHFLAQEFSPNIAIAGMHYLNWPAFNVNPATWSNTIGQALVTVGVGAQAAATIRFIKQAELYASTVKIIEPVKIGGAERYIVLLPSPQADYLKDPILQGNLGAVWRDVSSLTKEEMMYPGVIGRIGRCLIVEDPRYPTLVVGGTAGGFSLTPQYRLAGRDPWSDPRTHTLETRQVGYLLGKASIAKWQMESMKWRYEFEQYKKFGGKGVSQTVGYCMVQWDYGNLNTANPPTAATRQQDSSVVLIFSAPPALV